MSKTFMGVRLRTLRAERGLTQVALAQMLGLSPSYLNQIEQNQRPLTVAVLLRISKTLGVDVQQFSDDEEARLVARMREALADNPGGEAVALPELREVASQMPAVARALLALHRRHQEAQERLELMAAELGDGRGDISRSRPMPFEVVRDFFFAHQNHFDPLDTAAESLAAEARAHGGPLAEWLQQRLLKVHGVRVVPDDEAAGALDSQRRYDPASRVLRLSAGLEPGQQAFQLATQLALLEQAALIESLVAQADFGDAPAHALARIGLANYFAAAVLLPYGPFLQAAEALRYDIDLLARQFGVGFETVCHRLSSMQRPGASGVPFFFIRVDRQHLQATVGHALPLLEDRRHLPAVERVRGLCTARARAAAAGAHARRPRLPVDCTHRVARPARLRLTEQDLLDRPGLRHPPRPAPGLRQGPRPEGPRRAHAHRHGLQGVRARGLPAAGISVHRSAAGCERERKQVHTVCGGGGVIRRRATGASWHLHVTMRA